MKIEKWAHRISNLPDLSHQVGTNVIDWRQSRGRWRCRRRGWWGRWRRRGRRSSRHLSNRCRCYRIWRWRRGRRRWWRRWGCHRHWSLGPPRRLLLLLLRLSSMSRGWGRWWRWCHRSWSLRWLRGWLVRWRLDFAEMEVKYDVLRRHRISCGTKKSTHGSNDPFSFQITTPAHE